MKKLWVIALLFCIPPAMAQEAAPAATTPPPPVDAGTTAAQSTLTPAPAIPEGSITLQPNSGNFPPLPPSRPCARPDADGLWKLKNVFEKPRGPTSADFANNPHQYILFLRDDSYRTYKEIWGEKTPEQVKYELETTPVASVQQFVVHESGMLFFYVDGQNIDSQACFIVANELGQYKPGDMILMPPEGRIATRLALVYERVIGEPVIKPDPDEPIKPRKRVRRSNN